MNKDIDSSLLVSVNEQAACVLAELLQIMRKMHNYALDNKWDDVDRLNKTRNGLLSIIGVVNKSDSSCNNAVQEILLLDKAVLNLTEHALNAAASQILSANRKSLVCQKYQAVSLVKNHS